MLESDELVTVASAYGVADGQVRRDHLISHVLLALSTADVPVTFFGGTALARTFLTDPEIGARLSEDIDLCAAERADVAATPGSIVARRATCTTFGVSRCSAH